MRTPIPAALAAHLPGANPSRLALVVPAGFGPTLAPPRPGAAAGPATASTLGPPAANLARLYELAVTSAAMGFHESAIETLHRVTTHAPDHALAWRKLAELLPLAGKLAEAAAARDEAARTGTPPPRWNGATGERFPAKLEKADRKLAALLREVPPQDEMTVLRDVLFSDPLDVVAMRRLAVAEWRADDGVTALALLERALALSPGYTAAREVLTELLLERRLYARLIDETAILLAQAPRKLETLTKRSDALAHIGRYDEAIEILEVLLKQKPDEPRFWLSYGNMLHFVGRRDDAVKAYRSCLQLSPESGHAYWGLADLKGNFLTADDVVEMRALLASNRLDAENRTRVYYALAHYHERAKDYAASFAAYDEGARAFRDSVGITPRAYNPEEHTERLRRIKKVYSASTLAARRARAPRTSQLDTPIFVIGMPRAGSTLVEQILASHSMVEGTRELSVVGDITRDLTLSRLLLTPVAYPECITEFSADEVARLGERYVREAAFFRNTNRPYFIDKRPWNWIEAGLIDMILPHAKLIDIRRAPMAACFAMFKQMLPPDAAFSYDLNALGRYYNEYVNMMEHHEQVMPGRVLRVEYERLVDDTETEIRRMLDYCGLPFEESCLRFWQTDRAVATPSAEQVRRPIFRDALEQWRNFEQWLGPLKESLARPVRI